MTERRRSQTPSGDDSVRDPYYYGEAPPVSQEELPMIRAVDYVRAHPRLFTGIGIWMLVILVLDLLGWVDWRVLSTLSVIIGSGYGYYRSNGPQASMQVARKRWRWLALTVFVLPLLAPYVLAYYGQAFTKDFDRQMNPPYLIFNWGVNPEHFSAKERKLLSAINPEDEKGAATRQLILDTAWLADIEVDTLKNRDDVTLEPGEKPVMIHFGSRRVPAQLPDPKHPGQFISGHKGQLLVFFVYPNEEGAAEEPSEEKGETPSGKPIARKGSKKRSSYTIVVKEATDLQVTFDLLAKGFAEASGHELDIRGLDQLRYIPSSTPPPTEEEQSEQPARNGKG
ncbi:hypothetical protein JXD20_02275 [Candidatus Peregrinibacteria bacterium]|nr:hypothetical protein [Candidatus Peregrinibacteria bacterium]